MSSFNGFKEVTEKLDAIDFNPYKKIGKEWFLVTAGDESGWNTMTASTVESSGFLFDVAPAMEGPFGINDLGNGKGEVIVMASLKMHK